jgi:hypothetical protein
MLEGKFGPEYKLLFYNIVLPEVNQTEAELLRIAKLQVMARRWLHTWPVPSVFLGIWESGGYSQ